MIERRERPVEDGGYCGAYGYGSPYAGGAVGGYDAGPEGAGIRGDPHCGQKFPAYIVPHRAHGISPGAGAGGGDPTGAGVPQYGQ